MNMYKWEGLSPSYVQRHHQVNYYTMHKRFIVCNTHHIVTTIVQGDKHKRNVRILENWVKSAGN